jgi:hypothetical protein
MQIILPSYITDDLLISCDAPEDDPNIPEWDSTVEYITGQRVAVTDPGVHNVYEAVWHTPSNLNYYPPDNLVGTPPWWMLIGATNRWKLFDMIVAPERCEVANNNPGCAWEAASLWEAGTTWATFSYTTMQVTVLPGEIDSVAIMNSDVTSVTVVMEDLGEAVHYETNVPTTTAFNNLLFQDLPSYPNATVQVILRNSTAATIYIGEIVFGMEHYLGRTKYGVGVGLTDYSIKQADEWGNFSILERSFSKRIDCNFTMETSAHSGVMRLLEKYRSIPLVWIVSDLYSTTIIYGFYRDFEISIPYLNMAECALNIEGLGADLVYATPATDDWSPPWSGYLELETLELPSLDSVTMATIDAIPVSTDLLELTTFDLPTFEYPRGLQYLYLKLGTCTISSAEPTVITFAGHGLPNNHRVLFHAGTADALDMLPSPLSPDQVYYAENAAIDTFNITLTILGSTIDTTDDGQGVFTLYKSNDYYIDADSCSHAHSADGPVVSNAVLGMDSTHSLVSDNVIVQPILLIIGGSNHSLVSDNLELVES